jgi:hypothetical protein
MSTQSVIDHIRAATPKGTRNRYLPDDRRRDLLARFLIISADGAGIIGLGVILTALTIR